MMLVAVAMALLVLTMDVAHANRGPAYTVAGLEEASVVTQGIYHHTSQSCWPLAGPPVVLLW